MQTNQAQARFTGFPSAPALIAWHTTWDPEIFLQLLPKIGPRHVPFEEGSFIHLKEKGADSLCISLQSCLALAKLKSDPERERLELLPGRFRLSPAPLFSCHFLRS